MEVVSTYTFMFGDVKYLEYAASNACVGTWHVAVRRENWTSTRHDLGASLDSKSAIWLVTATSITIITSVGVFHPKRFGSSICLQNYGCRKT